MTTNTSFAERLVASIAAAVRAPTRCARRQFWLLAAAFLASACHHAVEHTIAIHKVISDARHLERIDSTLVVHVRTANGAAALPRTGLFLQSITDAPLDTIAVVMSDSVAVGTALRIWGRVKLSDLLQSGVTVPIFFADSVAVMERAAKLGPAAIDDASVPPLLLTILAMAALVAIAWWVASHLGRGWLPTSRQLDIDALRRSVLHAEGAVRVRRVQEAERALNARRAHLEKCIARANSDLAVWADAPGDDPNDQHEEAVAQRYAAWSLPLDFLGQVSMTIVSDSAASWQQAVLWGAFWTALFAGVGVATVTELLHREGETRRTIHLAKKLAKALLVIFFFAIALFMFARGASAEQAGVLGTVGWLLNLAVWVVAYMGGLHAARAHYLGRKRRMRETRDMMVVETAQIDEALPEFAAPRHAAADSASDAPAPAPAYPVRAIGALAIASALSLGGRANVAHAYQAERRVVVERAATPADAPTAHRAQFSSFAESECAVLPDVSASLGAGRHGNVDSLFLASFGELHDLAKCTSLGIFPFTRDTTFWRVSPSWFLLGSTEREVATAERCPRPDLRSLGPLIGIGTVKNKAIASSVKQCQQRLDGDWHQRQLQFGRSLDSAAHFLRELPIGSPSEPTALVSSFEYAVHRAFAVAVFLTDACESAGGRIPEVTVTSTTVIFLLMPADSAYGGADASAECAAAWTRRVRGRFAVVPWTDLGRPGIWSRVFATLGSGPGR